MICIRDSCSEPVVDGAWRCIKHHGRYECRVDGCHKFYQRNGFCGAHGGGKYCQYDGCPKHAQKDSDFCRAHGAELPLCRVQDCSNVVQSKGVCRKHGAPIKMCSFDGCEKTVKNSGLCKQHGAKRRLCSEANCNRLEYQSGKCHMHSSGNCTHDGCFKQARVNGLCNEHNPEFKCINCGVMWVKKRGAACAGKACKGRGRTKEYQMVDYVRAQFPEHVLHHNTVIETSCHRYRPDLRIELPDRLICVECDEGQHISYECDIPRMVNIVQDTGLPTVFIRWNPDYCGNKTPMKKRLEALAEKVQQYLDRPIELFPQGYPLVEYMFYTKVAKNSAQDELVETLKSLSISTCGARDQVARDHVHDREEQESIAEAFSERSQSLCV